MDRAISASAFLKKLSTPSTESVEEAIDAPPSFDHLELPGSELKTVERSWRKAMTGQEMDDEERFALEAIIIPDRRPAIDIIAGDYAHVAHPDWATLNEPTVKNTLLDVLRSVGRVEVSGDSRIPYGGTAFVVGEDLVMTNRHVARLFATGLGRDGLRFKTGFGSAIDFARDRAASEPLGVRAVVMIHPYWDMALLRVDGLADAHPRLTLACSADTAGDARPVALIGYPAFDTRNPKDVQDRVFKGVYGVKRLLPGRLGARRPIDRVSALTHDASTLGGNSGSVVLDMATKQVVGLHFAGRYLEANFAVPAFELARDARVAEAGVTFAPAARADDGAALWWAGVETMKDENEPRPQPVHSEDSSVMNKIVGTSGQSLTLTIPIEISIRIGPPAQQEAPAPQEISLAEHIAAGSEDPGAPASGAVTEAARRLANEGEAGIEADSLVETEAAAPPTLAIDMSRARAFLDACRRASVGYGLGKKVPRHGATPGSDFKSVDCSGFVRELIWLGTMPHFNFPDGSVVQHDWIRDRGFAPSSVQDAKAGDGVVRIAFLRPQDSPQRIGHVVVVHNGRTFESHGGVGPDSRPWTGAGWQRKARVYVLSADGGAESVAGASLEDETQIDQSTELEQAVARQDREGAEWLQEHETAGAEDEAPQLQGASSATQISAAAFELIIGFEVTSQRVYERKYRHPEWPQGGSGVTIGIGYDVGYVTRARLHADWDGEIDAAMVAALETAIGVTGAPAGPLARRLAGVDVPWTAAISVHRNKVLPRWVRIVEDALPHTDALGGDCLGALVSLVYNRGASFAKRGPRYTEMRNIKAHMTTRDFSAIPAEIRAMKRLWPGVPGLQNRRELEARLFEAGLAIG